MRLALVTLCAALLSGCAHEIYQPVPKGYAGPTATVRDSAVPGGSGGADTFYVNQADGHDIWNARDYTEGASRGHGMALTSKTASRPVQLRPMALELVGRRLYASPIQTLTHTVFQVKGTINFTPELDQVYVVKGSLDDAYSAVWLEDEATQAVIDHKIEVHGSTALKHYEK